MTALPNLLFPMALLTLLAGCAAAPASDAAANRRAAPPSPVVIDVPTVAHPAGETPEWWFRNGAAAAHRNGAGQGARPKNVILFLGDGMSLSTIAAARILEGQRQGRSGEEQRLAFEDFPHTALSRTYNVDAQTPDSAGTMTAIMTGVKARMGSISVNQRAPRGSCAASKGNEAVSLLELAAAAGMATGAVTTARITHATPAATFGHVSDRNWEYDGKLPPTAVAEGCVDLARQLLDFPFGAGLNVAFGGGRVGFLPSTMADPVDTLEHGGRKDGRNLATEWAARPGSSYVWNATQLAALDPARSRHVLGLFGYSHLDYEHERTRRAEPQPSLAEMTRAAIGLLKQQSSQGYFLMVEGGRIDHGHHAGNAFRALNETVAMSDAVRVADQLTSDQDTLIVVTSDHSHVMTFSGYPARGNPILGLLRGISFEEEGEPQLIRDLAGKPFTTLNYANGSGFAAASEAQPAGAKQFPHTPKRAAAGSERPQLDAVDTTAPDFLQEAMIPLSSETHSGEDVAVFARGPGADAVRGSLEQNALFHLIAQAQPRIREQLCVIGSCNTAGVPVELPSLDMLRQAAGKAH